MDAAGPVDAQTAPTGPWKTEDGFPQRPQPVILLLIQESSEPRKDPQAAGSPDFRAFS